MHAQLETRPGYTLMASDAPTGREHIPGHAISISRSGDDQDASSGYCAGSPRAGT